MAAYEIEREIGRNDFHALHRATRTRDGASCLLKLPRLDQPRGIDLELLRREQQILTGLRLPNLARALELTQHDGRACLVFEAVGGVPLRALLAAGPLELRRFFAVAIGMCRVVADLHRGAVTHGGLHPDAVLVDDATGALTVFDLGFASRGRAAIEPLPLHLLHDALPYLSPEQTGRMNRSIDHRSDLYSLGVILYEMLVGRPPFRSTDPLEMLHAHVARQPLPPSQAGREVPAALSAVVMKLLSKTAEERYQSAHGLVADLETCALQWAEHAKIEPFQLATRDVPDRFLISQKLYGRDREVALLHRAFDWVCGGPSAMVLVSGYSGIGKTSLIQELYKPIVMQRGAFAAGKFDQVVRDIPYGALIQAFQGLVQQLLAQSEERLAVWRDRLLKALGPNGGVIVEVIPEIELIIGPQTRPPVLGPTESQNRFRFVLQNFVGTLARPEHPLVIFLDDLQWVDAATLDLLEPLLASADVGCLLLIGAYRDNEVDAAHPLTVALRALSSSTARVETISLTPLRLSDLTQFIADTLHDQPAAVQPLAGLILEKTGGNPFFVIQFLETLHEDGLLAFDQTLRRWRFRIDDIERAPLTANVVDLMTRKIQRLPEDTRRVLTLAACIGNSFDVGVLSIASDLTPTQVAEKLAGAIAERLLIPARREYESAPAEVGSGTGAQVTTYTFLHDRVQQAAYGLIPEQDRRLVHLTVGRLLLKRWDDATAEEKVFDVVHHLNLGRALLGDPAERLALARLNLIAGRKAKSSTAYREALRYLGAGCALLDAGHWSADYELAFDLHLEAAACEYLCGQFAAAERYFELLRARAATRLDMARICNLEVLQCENMSRYADAVRAARAGLALFDLVLPDSAAGTDAALRRELATIEHLLGGRSIDALVDLAGMADPEVRSVLQLLTTAWAPTFLSGNAALTRLISAIIVRLSLQHGNAEESAYGYVTHAITVGPILHDYRSAYDWGRLALAVNEHFNDRRLRAKIHQQFQAHVNLWRRPLETCIPHAREACRSGLETGDFTYAGYGAFTESWPALLTSRDLERFSTDYAASVSLLEKIQMGGFADAQRVILAFAGALTGRTRDRLSFSDEQLDEDGYLRRYADNPFFLAIFHTLKLYLCVLFGDSARAAEQVVRAREVDQAIDGTVWPVLLDFLEGLTVADCAAGGAAPARLTAIAASLGSLAAEAPENFGCFAALLQAEIARLEGRDGAAQASYDAAIRRARQSENPANEALANERCAHFGRAGGNDRLAARCLTEAQRAYARWGATRKTHDLALRHPELLGDRGVVAVRSIRPADAALPMARDVDDVALDVATFAKAASAIAMEIILDDLLRILVRIAIENAGAERGVFVREVDRQFVVEASGSVDQDDVALSRSPLGPDATLSRAVLEYVRRTGRSVVVADATTDARFAADPYVVQIRPRSILAVPIVHQGRRTGILYLENNLTADAFTVERVRVLQILSGQAAIALENARLYEEMRREVELRRRAEADLRQAMGELEKLKNRLQAENIYLQEEIRHEHNFEEIVGTSPSLLACLGQLERVAPTDATVLIYGETGTGKELLARALHRRSGRAERPLTKVNCGAIPAGLVESELFGHVRGAFTGALERRVGRFELADGGTIFLDEVGELPLETQVKLLRVLQEHEFEPLGSNRTVRVDVRVVAATNRDLETAVREGRFRADLYYRLSVFPLRVPALRERVADIPLLVTYLVERFAKKIGRRVDSVTRETMDRLVRYTWPGNVRELQNVLERAVILSPGPMLVLDDALQARATPAAASPGGGEATAPAARASIPERQRLQDVAREHIVQTLARTQGIIDGPRGAAQLLNVRPSTLRSRMKKLGIR